VSQVDPLAYDGISFSRFGTSGEQHTVHNSLLIILVVEDEPLIQDMVHEALSDGGFGTKIAGSGEAAVKLLEDNEGKYRALITDIHLGVRVMGWDVAKRARELNREIEAHRSRAIAAAT
jgi:CheY-like chemotaxis protein